MSKQIFRYLQVAESKIVSMSKGRWYLKTGYILTFTKFLEWQPNEVVNDSRLLNSCHFSKIMG